MKKMLKIIFLFVIIMCSSCSVSAANVIVTGGTELVGELVTPLNSKVTKKNDPIIFKLAQNLIINNAIILEKGTSGKAIVTQAHKATYFGQGGGVGFKPESIKTANGVEIPLTFEVLKRGSAVNDANMVVATVGLGVFAAFFHGKNQTFPAGTRFKFYVEKDTDLGVDETELSKHFYILNLKAKRE
jgi:hypothetical protein